MINLYIFNETSRAAVYGIGTYIRELLDALKDSNVKVCIVHLRAENPKKTSTEETDNIQQWYFPPPLINNNTLDWRSQTKLYYRNIVYLLKLQIKDTDQMVFQLNYNQSEKLAEELKRVFYCKIVTVIHYNNWGFSIYDNLPRLKKALNEESEENLKKTVEDEKLLYTKSDRVVCLTNYMHEILCCDYGLDSAKISFIPNGLSDIAESKPHFKLLRKKWNVPVREKIILFAGRMDEIKGLIYLIKAFREVLKVYPNCRLVIAGNGSFDRYTKESKDIYTKITYTGLLDKPQLYELYCLANIGVVPSLFEPFGYVAVEMMMHRLPVVVTETSGLNEIVDDNCGLKVPLTKLPDNVEIDTMLLSEKILYLLQHPSEAKKKGRNGRKRYLKEYSSEVFRKNMLEFYQSLFNNDK